ncbi:WhiB family transcriptional regulator [Streptomyces chartreusis]|uniref:WhiB family transcriptional regulator n=1 Tax=Streptomyces chartreusis TaxID=1969 RepID=UPI00340287AE
MTRHGVGQPTAHVGPDPRFPFPHHPTRTACQQKPQLFDFTNGDRAADREATDQRLAQARKACTRCPIARDCLKWALVNKAATKVGVFAATTPGQRTELRKRLADRLGADWIDVLADQDQARREKAAETRHTPLTVDQARMVRLDREVNGELPAHRRLTREQQQHNAARLMTGLGAYPSRSAQGSGRTKEELAAVRTWARGNGHQVADVGMIRRAVLEAYDAAHQAPAAKAG